jgi:predicted Zn-dependent peptidase
MDADTPDDHVHTLLYESVFPGHPLGRETAGDRITVAAMQPRAIRAFHRRWYVPTNLVVSVAGACEHDVVVREIERCFDFSDRERHAAGPVRDAPQGRVRPLAVERRRTEQVHLALGWRGLARQDPDREALDVANHILGGGMSSRLFDEIRDKRGLAYSVFSAPAGYRDAGMFTVYAGTAPSHIDEVLDLVDAELARFVTDGVTDDERDVAVGYLTGSFVLGLEDPASRMSRHASQLSTLGHLRPVEDQVGRYATVSGDDIVAVAKRIVDAPRALAVVGPVARKTLLARVA